MFASFVSRRICRRSGVFAVIEHPSPTCYVWSAARQWTAGTAVAGRAARNADDVMAGSFDSW